MPSCYTPEDRARTSGLFRRLLAWYGPLEGQDAGPWFDADEAALVLDGRVGTLLSKGRELNDYHHIHLGLDFQSDRVKGGKWRYRIAVRKPEQLPLLEEAHA